MIDTALSLGLPEPVETYSSSEHLYELLNIPAGSTGRLNAVKKEKPAPRSDSRASKEPTPRKEAAPRKDAGPKRERVRTKRIGQ
jgi:hypothetical protein